MPAKLRSSLLALVALTLAGCKTLVPYDSEFACAKSHDYGQCMDVQSAYDDARSHQATQSTTKGIPAGQSGARAATASAATGIPERRGDLIHDPLLDTDPAQRLRDTRYRELAGLIEDPVTPVVQAPRVLRTLIVAYSAGDTLYLPRYVYYFAEEAKFVLGDYLDVATEDRTLYPAGPGGQP